ncbi:MAG: peptidase [Deltaproteobacteria bacterium RBG_16_55_12]|nr:MAG: peptidase [Deltaproteobacteria bacterium GWD2_55_8]OGP98749.1 MAG: peptidase [Deltaproteobacteria bacterium RBG_16_55_12]OGQ66314.1 MAG: peptidase [Deltaproteobacteria bacterium RIFCSPLOWO2_12_55_13]
MIEETIIQISIWALPVLAAIVFHEVAHGWVAYRFGDPTAARMGRLTLNPISHIDLFGTIILPLLLIVARSPFLFGYAKPVPVNFYNLNHPKRDMIWVALAGPLTNILLALGSVLILKFLRALEFSPDSSYAPYLLAVLNPVYLMAKNSVVINVVLAVFNAFPIPPLDGGRVLVGVLPEPQSSALARVEPYGFLIILVLLMSHVMDAVMGPAVYFLLRLFDGIL